VRVVILTESLHVRQKLRPKTDWMQGTIDWRSS